MFGGVVVEEFCPFSLSRRTSSFYRLPLTSLQVTPAIRRDTTSSLEKLLVSQKLVTATPQPKRWDVVRIRPMGMDADASYLCFYLDTPNQWVTGQVAPSRGRGPQVGGLEPGASPAGRSAVASGHRFGSSKNVHPDPGAVRNQPTRQRCQ